MGPNFICIGAQKAGSTWLYDQVRSHPKAWMPPIKEIRYFTALGSAKRRAALQLAKYEIRSEPGDPRNVEFVRRLASVTGSSRMGQDFSEYIALFEPAGEAITGDISPGYVQVPEALAKKLAAALPDCKFLFLLREPSSRLWSQINMVVRKGRVGRQALINSKRLRSLPTDQQFAPYSFQSKPIRLWRDLVGEQRFQVFVMDDLHSDPDGFRRNIFNYIGLDANECEIPASHNRKTDEMKLPLPDDLRAVLDDVFAAERAELARLVGGVTKNWG